MDVSVARRLIAELPADAVVVDVGGGASPFPRADYVIDALAFEAAGAGSDGSIHKQLGIYPRYSPERWIQADVCGRARWPVADKQFDYVVCSHLLEDIRDPIWVCSELARIGKAGYIEAPSRTEEQSLGVEHPRYAGYYHHRWLISRDEGQLSFRHKPHNLHAIRDAIVTSLAPGRRINPKYSVVSYEWSGTIQAREVLEFSESNVVEELCAVAAESRRLPELTVRVPMGWGEWVKRSMYYWRLSRGGR
jgi:hypothetical protein